MNEKGCSDLDVDPGTARLNDPVSAIRTVKLSNPTKYPR